MKIHKIILVIVFSMVIFAACAQSQEAPVAFPKTSATTAPTKTPLPTDIPTDIPTTTPTLEPSPTVTPIFVDTETRDKLASIEVPINDPNELAQRLKGLGELPAIEAPEEPLQVGTKDTFWVSDYTDKHVQIEATLHYVTDHAYFWVDDTAEFEPADLEILANKFENKIYPVNRRFFGSEWSPGIDNDEHIYIIFARRVGIYTAGYFSSADEMHPLAHDFSNGHEMFVLNIDNVEMADEFTWSTLAHEFQHMIHWYHDRNENVWVNEGFAEVAQLINNFPIGGTVQQYASDPDTQLNTWTGDSDENFKHYGNSFLFFAYFLDRLGKEATQALADHSENGLTSIDAVLSEMNATDPLTGDQLTADDLVLDWGVTNFIRDENVGDGRFDYYTYKESFQTKQTELIRNCEVGPQEYDVHQYGVDYIRVLCPGQYTLRFDGAVENKLVAGDPYSGDYSFWSHKGDSSDITLTQEFDFTEVEGPLTFNFWTWYDIEKDFDYIYLVASADGENWEQLETPLMTDSNPNGSNYGWAYTGKTRSSAWVQESVDISQFAGNKVQIRFEYITDLALHHDGMLVDDIEIPEIGYFTDFEEDEGGWESNGWARIKNVLPQTFRLALITVEGDSTTVEYIPMGVNNIADIPLDIPEEGKSVILVIIGTTRFTTEIAPYTIDFIHQ
ncbi:MAG: immune inhibitor A [Anaerolineales bacterium]|nr:immune inhibitor A [Chloroflexota bacterium]MBL6982235.1 immune inhibitor A [Anaerolineales bacterium]